MSKRALKNYVAELKKEQLEAQVIDLYERFPIVKTYFDFVFNPGEDKLVREAKKRITNEYFPVRRKRPRARRSVAQKYIRHFIQLGLDPLKLADVMLFNLETAMRFSRGRNVPETFYKSMLNSFEEALGHISLHGLLPDFKSRITAFYKEVREAGWLYGEGFSRALDRIE